MASSDGERAAAPDRRTPVFAGTGEGAVRARATRDQRARTRQHLPHVGIAVVQLGQARPVALRGMHAPTLVLSDHAPAASRGRRRAFDPLGNRRTPHNLDIPVVQHALDRVRPSSAETNESYLQRQDLHPAYVFDGAIFVRRQRLLEEWRGRDFCLGSDVRGLPLPAESFRLRLPRFSWP